jgi:DNA-binding transcriptional LysR family regulator
MAACMELRQLAYFECIVRHRHFGRAAAELHVAQPSLSQQLQQLEHELKVELIERGKGTFRLTRAGEAFLLRSQRILDEVNSAMREMSDFRKAATGEVRLGAVTFLASIDLARLIAEFRAAHGGITVKLVEVSNPQILEGLRLGRIDVALLGWFNAMPIGEGIVQEQLFDESIVAVVGKQHRLSKEYNVPLREFAEEQLILPRARSMLHRELLKRMEAAGFEPRVAFEVRDAYVGLQLAASNLGVQFVPRSMASALTTETTMLEFEPALTVTAGLAWRERYCCSATRAFLDFVRQFFGKAVVTDDGR